MNESELKSDIEFVNGLHNKVIHLMRIRLGITENRMRAIRRLEYNHNDAKAKAMLEKCVDHEREIMGWIEDGIERTHERLKIAHAWLKQHTNDRDIISKSRRLLQILKIFSSRLDAINNRLALEERFLEKPDPESFKDFLFEWKKEIKLNKKLLQKTVDTTDIQTFFKKMRAIFKRIPRSLTAAAVFGAGGATLQKIIHIPQHEALTENEAALLLALTFALHGFVANMIMEFRRMDSQLESVNIKELREARKAI